MSHLFGTTISNLIRQQFPAHYREHGPILVSFVTEYYKWLEGQSLTRSDWFVDKVSLITVTNRSANVVGKGSFFVSQFSNGDSIAISKGSETTDYEMFTIKNIANDTFLTLTPDKLPTFNHSNTRYATVSSKPNALYYTRNFSELNDIDETLDQFVVYFKEKYLKNLQFDTITDTKTLVKHSLDLYRSKGTERSIDLLYKVVFGVPSHVYYPGQDIFRLSSGDWYIPQYLELTLSEDNRKLINREIVGVLSGATAFVEEIIRRVIGSKVIEIAYISAVDGIFMTGEKVTLADSSLEMHHVPTVIGSLNEVEISIAGSGSGFTNNQLVDIVSLHGRGARGKVTSISNTEGQMLFTFVDGGYGYIQGSGDVNTYVSENVLSISNATFASDFYNHEYVEFLDTLTQPLAVLNYVNANGVPSVGNELFTYYPNNAVKGHARALLHSETTANAGILTISVLSGDMNEPAVFTAANSIGMNLAVANGYTDLTVTAQVIGNYSNVSVVVNNYSGLFVPGGELIQPDTDARGFITAVIPNESNTELTVYIANSEGIYKSGFSVTGSQTGHTGTIVSTNFEIGVVNTSADFYSYQNNYVSTAKMAGSITSVSTGSGAALTFSNTLTHTESVTVAVDLISAHLSEVLNATWNFPANPTATLSSVIASTLTYANYTIGKISGLLSTGPGTNYTRAPIVKLNEPDIYIYGRPDTVVLTLVSTTGFQVGEIVTQEATTARGMIKGISGDDLVLQNMRFNSNNYFVVTSGATTDVVGSDSGAISNVEVVAVRTQSPRLGDDVTVGTELVIGEGAVTSVRVLDSGFGFVLGEEITITANGSTANGYANLITHGTGSGYYKSRDGFLSDTKMLSDGYYWQEYSYEVQSSVIDDFKKTLKNIVHVAGTKYFDALYYDTQNPANTDINTTMSLAGPGSLQLRDGSALLLRDGESILILSHPT